MGHLTGRPLQAATIQAPEFLPRAPLGRPHRSTTQAALPADISGPLPPGPFKLDTADDGLDQAMSSPEDPSYYPTCLRSGATAPRRGGGDDSPAK